MKKEYRVWNDGSPQGHYIMANSPKNAAIVFVSGCSLNNMMSIHYPIHAILWKKGKKLYSLKMTEVAIHFRDYKGIDKYYKFGKKYRKEDFDEVKSNGKITLD